MYSFVKENPKLKGWRIEIYISKFVTSPQKIGAFRNREFGERSDFLNNNGEKSLKDFFEEREIDIFDIHRDSVIYNQWEV